MLTCSKCDGRLCQDNAHDLPRLCREYYCVNCGERFWIDARVAAIDTLRARLSWNTLPTPN